MKNVTHNSLPPGQFERDDFPRFGLLQYADRFRAQFDQLSLTIAGAVNNTITLNSNELEQLQRVEQTSDFHCVTTWSKTGIKWSGFRFCDFYELFVKQKAQPHHGADFVLFRCQDGFRTMLPLMDLLREDVILADRFDGQPLTAEHGAPLRLVAPAHYGYKNAKHVKTIELHIDKSQFKPPAPRFMDHPRARVEFEERGTGVPGWLLRYLYRPLIKYTVSRFHRAMHK